MSEQVLVVMLCKDYVNIQTSIGAYARFPMSGCHTASYDEKSHHKKDFCTHDMGNHHVNVTYLWIGCIKKYQKDLSFVKQKGFVKTVVSVIIFIVLKRLKILRNQKKVYK